MHGNICPVCGKDVMTYKRFLREAEPYKKSPCGSCGALLRRGKKVYLLLVVMCLVLVLLILPVLVIAGLKMIPNWLAITWGAVVALGGTFLTNYLGWRLVGWIPAEDKKDLSSNSVQKNHNE
jgi:fatty acid desaturase